jgi:uroporphyrinogen decarboxylase
MNHFERMDAALRLQPCDRVPVFPIHHYSSTRASGIKIGEYATNPQVMAESLIRAAEYMGYDAVLSGSDVAVESEALGSVCVQPEDAPAFISKPVLEEDPLKLDDLHVPDPQAAARMPVVVEATRILRKQIGGEIYIAATVMGPMNIAGQLRGVENLMMDTFDDPAYFEKLLDFTLEVSIVYAKSLIAAGADQIQAGEALCSPDLINPNLYRDVILPRHRIWAKELSASGARSTLIHVCGDIRPILEDLGQTGTTCIDVDYMVDMREARERSGIAVRGNVNPSAVMLLGRESDVETAAMEILKTTYGMTGIILGTGCDIPPAASNANVKMLTRVAEKYGKGE